MRTLRSGAFTMAGLVCLALVSATPIAAAPGGNGNGNGNGATNGNGGNGNAFGLINDTPELDSLVLFGVGATGMVGYGLMRLRAARRRDQD